MNRISLLLALLLLLSACVGTPDRATESNDDAEDSRSSADGSSAEKRDSNDNISAEESDPEEAQPPLPTVHFDRPFTLDGQELLLHFSGFEERREVLYTQLQLLDPADDALLYETSLLVYGYEVGIPADIIEGSRYNNDILEFIDVDFDGYTDMRMFCCFDGNWNIGYHYILRDPATGGFTGDRYGLESLGLPSFDAEERLVHSMQRGSAIDHWYYTHQYRDGELVTIQEVEDLGLRLSEEQKAAARELIPEYGEDVMLFHMIRRVLDESTGALVVAEEYFSVSDPSGWGRSAYYPPDTPQFQALLEILDS